MSRPRIFGQEGRVLILALMILAVSSLLIPPFLSHITVKLHATRSTEEGMKAQYASDAGVEYAIGQLLYNPSFYSSVITTGVTTVITVPHPVNGIWPIRVTMISREPVFRGDDANDGYVVWANSPDCTGWGIDIQATDVSLVGNVHTNTDIRIKAKTAEMTGTLEYVTTHSLPADMRFNPSEDNPRRVSVTPQPPIQLSIEDYQPGGRMAEPAQGVGEYYYVEWCSGQDCLDEFGVVNGHIPSGLYYVESGDVELSQSALTGTVTIVAEEGVIDVSGEDAHLSPYCSDGVLLFSNGQTGTPPRCNRDVIKCDGENATWEGIVYGPGGRVSMGGTGGHSVSLIGNTVYFKDKRAELRPFAAGGSELCPVFDMISVATDSTTTSQVVLCQGAVSISSWHIQ